MGDSQAARPAVAAVNERRSTPFRTVRVIARGEDAEVVLASSSRRTSPGTPRWVAVKRLRPDRHGDPETRDAFMSEIRMARLLRHPRLPRTFAAEGEGRSPWLAMDYVDGPDLATLLLEASKRGRRLDLRGLWYVMMGVVEALHFLHTEAAAQIPGTPPGSPLLHGDLVPDNVLVSSKGEVRLADLGRAWFVGSDSRQPAGTRGFTPALTPEQARGLPLDARSDIFLFGVLFYEGLTGRHPFLRDTVHETAREVGRARPVPLEALRPVPPELAALVDRCLEGDPKARFQSSDQLMTAMRGLDLPGAEDGRQELAAEIAAAFPAHGSSERPWVLRGGSFHPPFLPMVLSWLPPPIVGPDSVSAVSTPLAAPGPTQLGPDTGRVTKAEAGVPPPETEPDFTATELVLPSVPDAAPPPGPVPIQAAETLPFPQPALRKKKRRRKSVPAAQTQPSVPPRAAPWDGQSRLAAWLRTAAAGALGAGLTSLVFLLFVPRTPEAPTPAPAPSAAEDPAPRATPGGSDALQPAAVVAVVLQSQPPGAVVRIDGEVVGKAPVTVQRPPGALLQVTVSADGFGDASRLVPVPDEGGAFTIRLGAPR